MRTEYKPDITECVNVHFPKTELTDRTFGLIDPYIHNDIAFHISRNWKSIVEALIPSDSIVTSYSFPIPIDSRTPGRMGYLRSGRMIYEFIEMTDDDLAAVAYKYTHLVKADIKSFYPSIYTHSLAWALHSKKLVRKAENRRNYLLLGNRLDKLFQNANDGCTNGLPVGPVVSDVAAEIVAAGVDRFFSKQIRHEKIDCEVVRFKDDYRILVKSEADARRAIKMLQASLRDFNLELSDEKTKVFSLPNGLFREWVSRYHAVYPKKLRRFSWKQFRELYLAVVEIDKACPGTGVIDRFLADIVSKNGALKVALVAHNLEKVISMLLMLGNLRIKAFPKIIAILEAVLKGSVGGSHKLEIVAHLESFLATLSKEEKRNKYLISWIGYFLVSNDLVMHLTKRPAFKDPITRSIFSNRGLVFKNRNEFKLFVGCKSMARQVTMLEHLDVFSTPKHF
ncbi:MAG TPA: RNA-directed DNA polymerase [Usitatibacteraceae bacterium]|nr:RNA-directed DNA polymerase [Usitatibacteraceae bacterium]